MKKNGVKKNRRDPNALRKCVANILFRVARVLINLSGKVITTDNGVVSQSQVREIQNRWKRQQKELLYGLVFIHQNHIMADIVDAVIDGDGLLSTRRLLPSVRETIYMIDEMVDRYENMISMCHTKRDVKALSRCLQDDYYKIFADINQRIKRFEECANRWKDCQEFATRINAFRKELEDPFLISAVIEKSKTAPLLNVLNHILKDWEQTKLQNTISAFDTFYYNINRREQLIDRLWEEIIPTSNLSFEEYDPRRDEWHRIPYSYEQFH